MTKYSEPEMTELEQEYGNVPLEKPLRITEHNWPAGTLPLVSITCITYNHVNFIRDAIESFLMQETTFPVEILIHDDASTDGTAEILRDYEARYPLLIKAICQAENQYSKGKKPRDFIWPLLKGAYIAFCEGDDYWIQKMKLEQQLRFHRSKSDCTLTFHRSSIESFGTRINVGSNSPSFGSTGFFENGAWFYEGGSSAPTCSLVVNKSVIDPFPAEFAKSPVGDMPLKAFAASQGCVGYIDEVWSCRRIGVPGSWNVRVRFDSRRQAEYFEGMIDMLYVLQRSINVDWDQEIKSQQRSYLLNLTRYDGVKPIKKYSDLLGLDIHKSLFKDLIFYLRLSRAAIKYILRGAP